MRGLTRTIGLLAVWLANGFACGQIVAPTPSTAARMATAQGAYPLDEILEGSDLWQTSPERLLNSAAAPGFHWTSAGQDIMENRRPGLTLFKLRVYDVLARFEAGKMKELTVLFYDRGDAGEWSKADFDQLLGSGAAALTAFTKEQPQVRAKDPTSAVKMEGYEWQTAATHFTLEYSSTREIKERGVPFRAEFMRLKAAPAEKPQSLIATALSTPEALFSGPAHVKKAENGDVYIEGIPMVDQGKKGYCVVASTERVLRYYGGHADEHELAEIANTSATQGTSNEAMIDSLKKLGARLHIKTRVLEPFDVKELLATINEYNHIARRGNRAKPIDLSVHVLDVASLYREMDPAILREARTKNKSGLDRFQRLVEAHIDEGIPILWAVMIGIVPEQNIPAGVMAGHMRLIIGYNLKTNEILYSDPWGPGHELTRMGAGDAWTITTSMSSVEPL